MSIKDSSRKAGRNEDIMIIDLVNPYVHQMKYKTESKVAQELYLYSPDDKYAERIEKVFDDEGFSNNAEKLIKEDETELTYILIDYQDRSVSAFRSITSHYELFYYQSEDETTVLTDQMVNMLSYIPVADRQVGIEGVCDTVLYQHCYGRDTFVKGVYRLGGGERIEIRNGRVELSLVQKLQLGRYRLEGESGADVLEESMRSACMLMKRKYCVNTLSGGVDSTLTHIVMGNPESVSASYEYEKFQPEKKYALDAARLLGADHTVYDIEMSDYMDLMKKVALAYGMPPYNLTAQVMHYVLAGKVDTPQMMLSELAGAVYGIEMRTPYTREKAERYPMEHPCNYSNMNSMVAAREDLDYIEKLFGGELVKGQLARRNDYVLERLEGFDTADISKDNCLQLGSLFCWFANSGMGILEQMENPFGKTVSALFSARQLVEKFLSLDLHNRYEDEVYGEKPYAKQLLERLLPGYEVNKPKLGGALPRTWMVTEGPMAGYFMEHDIPDFIDRRFYEDMRNPSWEVSWGVKYMIMYSIWYENVMTKERPGHPSKYKIETTF